MTAAALYLCWTIARPFLAAIAWALALAIIAEPWHQRLERRLHRNVAALLTVILITAILLAPATWLVHRAADELNDTLPAIGATADSTSIRDALYRVPILGSAIEWLGQRTDFEQELRKMAGAFARQASAFLSGSARFVAQFCLLLVILFFFLRDRAQLLGYLRGMLPMQATETDELFSRISKTVYATLYGNVVVKVVQGMLGGAMLWALGFPAPLILGTAMGFCAMLPVIGTALIWGPAAIILLLEGSWVKAIILATWGVAVVSLIDNVLYPVLVAIELRLHPLGVLLSIFGGLIAFGVAGVVLGPIIFASTAALFGIWQSRAGHEQEF